MAKPTGFLLGALLSVASLSSISSAQITDLSVTSGTILFMEIAILVVTVVLFAAIIALLIDIRHRLSKTGARRR
ncbi:MAG: hypothetical protein KGI04_01315 [Candidatus Micrarchaeota archaeon]|nr:hypothetical protein [Candidatus Micrarchaeota archaeon]